MSARRSRSSSDLVGTYSSPRSASTAAMTRSPGHAGAARPRKVRCSFASETLFAFSRSSTARPSRLGPTWRARSHHSLARGDREPLVGRGLGHVPRLAHQGDRIVVARAVRHEKLELAPREAGEAVDG